MNHRRESPTAACFAFPEVSPVIRRLVVASLILHLFLQLGSRGLNEPDEGRFAEMAREMLVSGDWSVPRIGGVPHYAKPPLSTWMVACSMAIFGINEWAARWPSFLGAVASLLVVYDLARRLANDRVALFAAISFSLMLHVYVMGRAVTTDMIMTGFVCVAVRAAVVMRVHARPPWFLIFSFWLSLGAAFLTKGPPALLIVFACLAGSTWIEIRRWRWWPLKMWLGLPIFLLAGLSWFLVMLVRKPELWDFFVGREVVGRVTTGNDRVKPVYFFIPVLFLGVWPWLSSFFRFLGSIPTLVFRGVTGRFAGSLSALAVAGFLPPFLFFSLVPGKLWTYLLPLFPWISLGLGVVVAGSLETRVWRWGRRLDLLLIPTAALGLLFFKVPNLRELPLSVLFWCLGGGASAWMIRRICRQRWPKDPVACSFLMTAAMCFGLVHGLHVIIQEHEGELGNNSSWRALCAPLLKTQPRGRLIPQGLEPPKDEVFGGGEGPRVLTYRMRFHAASFYLMGSRSEYVPEFASGSLWEMAGDRLRQRLDDLPALIHEIQKPGPLAVLTKSTVLHELRPWIDSWFVAVSIGGPKTFRLTLVNPPLKSQIQSLKPASPPMLKVEEFLEFVSQRKN